MDCQAYQAATLAPLCEFNAPELLPVCVRPACVLAKCRFLVVGHCSLAGWRALLD